MPEPMIVSLHVVLTHKFPNYSTSGFIALAHFILELRRRVRKYEENPLAPNYDAVAVKQQFSTGGNKTPSSIIRE